MKLESSGFNDKERIPDRFTLDFDNVSDRDSERAMRDREG